MSSTLEFSIKDIFLLELDFLRNVKKMRLFLDESRKWHESCYSNNIKHYDSLLLQFKQTVSSLFLTLLTNENPQIFSEFLVNFAKILRKTLEEQNKTDLMKLECISDLLVKFFWLRVFSNQLPNSQITLIIDLLALLAKTLMLLKQGFVELELKLLLSFAQKIVGEFEEQEYEGHLSELIENIMISNLVNNKIIEFFIENLNNSEPSACRYREKVRNLLIKTIFPRSSTIPLKMVVNFPELAVHPEVLQVLLRKYDANLLKSTGFSKIQLNFIAQNQQIPIKSEIPKEIALTQNKLNSEELKGYLQILLCGELERKIDVLIIFSDSTENQEVFVENAEEVLGCFTLVFREILLKNSGFSSQFLRFFGNNLQKLLCSPSFLDNVEEEGCLSEFFEEIILNLSKFIEIQNENSSLMIEMLNLCLFRCLSFCKTERILHFLLQLLTKYLKLPCYQRLLGIINLSLLKICEKIRNLEGSMDPSHFFEDLSLFLSVFSYIKAQRNHNNYNKLYEISIRTLKMLLYVIVEVNGLKTLEFIEKIEKNKQKSLDFQLKRWVSMIINPLNTGKSDRSNEIESLIKMINGNEGDLDENIIKLADTILETRQNSSEINLIHEYFNASLSRMLFILANENKIFHQKIKPGTASQQPIPKIPSIDPRRYLLSYHNSLSIPNPPSNSMLLPGHSEENLLNLLLDSKSNEFAQVSGMEEYNPLTLDEENLINFDSKLQQEDFSAFFLRLERGEEEEVENMMIDVEKDGRGKKEERFKEILDFQGIIIAENSEGNERENALHTKKMGEIVEGIESITDGSRKIPAEEYIRETKENLREIVTGGKETEEREEEIDFAKISENLMEKGYDGEKIIENLENLKDLEEFKECFSYPEEKDNGELSVEGKRDGELKLAEIFEEKEEDSFS